jgi:serine/threonine protein kinase
LSHASIIRLLDVFYRDLEEIVVVYELGGPSLGSMIRSVDIKDLDRKAIFRDIVKGVQYLHSKSICHQGTHPYSTNFQISSLTISYSHYQEQCC